MGEDEAAGLARSGVSGWSRCGEWPHSGSSSSGFAARRAAMPRICSSVPYSSSMPWIASTGQRMAIDLGLDVPLRERPVQPDVVPAPEGGVGIVVVAAEPLRRSVVAGRRRAPSRCWRSRRPRRRCAAPATTTPATRREARGMQQRDRAAVAVAEQPGRVVDAQRARTRPAAPRAPARCMKSTAQRSLGGARRRAAVAGAREHQAAQAGGVAQALREVASTSRPSPGLRAGRRRAARPAAVARPTRSYLDAQRAGPASRSRRTRSPRSASVDARARARAAGSAGSCRSRSSAARRRTR